MKQFLSYLIFSILFINSVWSQEIDVHSVSMKEFPKYSGSLWVRNPEGLDSSSVFFTEDGSPLTVTFQSRGIAEYNANKSVLCLVLNHQAHKDRTQWYKSILINSIENGIAQAGDEVSIVSFDCNRPEYGDKEKQILFPSKPSFTSKKEILLDQVDAINIDQKRFTDNCLSRGDIYGAVYKALEVYGATKTNLPKSIVVFADDLSLVRQIKEQGIIEKSREQNIPIYAITYHQNINRKYGLDQICQDTYGLYHRETANDANKARDAFFDFVSQMSKRAAGVIYPFEFDTKKDKTGNKETIKVSYKGEITAFGYDSPSLNILERIQRNLFLSIALLIFVSAIVVMLIVLRKKNKRIREQEELRRKEEMARLEEEQQTNAKRTKEQELQLERIKKDEEERKAAQKRKIEEEKQKELNEQKLIQMKSRGNLPWFTYDHHGARGSFEMNFPVFTVGRSKENSKQLDIPIVSGNHLKVEFNEGKYFVTDLKSTNGTFLNGERIETSEIRHGDVIIVGDINLTFHI